MISPRVAILALCLFSLLVNANIQAPIEEDPGFVPDLLSWKWRLREAKIFAWLQRYYGDFVCDVNCTLDTSSFASTEFVCTSQGTVIGNPFCTSAQVYVDCKSSEFNNNPTGGSFFLSFSFFFFLLLSHLFRNPIHQTPHSKIPPPQNSLSPLLPPAPAPPIVPLTEPVRGMAANVPLVTPEKTVNLLNALPKTATEGGPVLTWMTSKSILVFVKMVMPMPTVPLR